MTYALDIRLVGADGKVVSAHQEDMGDCTNPEAIWLYARAQFGPPVGQDTETPWRFRGNDQQQGWGADVVEVRLVHTEEAVA